MVDAGETSYVSPSGHLSHSGRNDPLYADRFPGTAWAERGTESVLINAHGKPNPIMY